MTAKKVVILACAYCHKAFEMPVKVDEELGYPLLSIYVKLLNCCDKPDPYFATYAGGKFFSEEELAIYGIGGAQDYPRTKVKLVDGKLVAVDEP